MKTESPIIGYAPAWRTKSAVARMLGISRKTVQRKVTSGELPEDETGRVCADRLAALLSADVMRGRRGPKLQLRTDKPRPRYEYRHGLGFVKTADHEDPADKIEGEVDCDMLQKLQSRMVKVSTATLRAIAGQAMTIAKHRARMARLGFKITPDEMLSALRRGQATAATDG
jgi:hypothetical protein